MFWSSNASRLPWSMLTLGMMLVSGACSERQEKSEGQTPVAELLGQGEAMVENLCVECHAIGPEDKSTHTDAPPLRDLSKRVDLADLRTPLTEGIMVEHPDMPDWAFEPHHVDALLYYLDSIQVE